MKAYCVYPKPDPFREGCLLIFANDRNEAKFLCSKYGPFQSYDYIDFYANRKKEYDKYYRIGFQIIETNDELPDGADPFYDDRIC